ncbi:MAG: putative DNA-binding domain-containing protein [Deltaproteobacteria bacterium]|nr:putative DNA-binding domain-containing protein [Deltaproteobacteria bacterium]
MTTKLINNDLKSVEDFWYQVCFNPQFKPEGRFSVYRDLTFNCMGEVLENICPVTRSLFKKDQWEALLWEYLSQSPPRLAILRELPGEAAAFFKKGKFTLKEDYPYLGELMEYEYAEVKVRFAPEDEEKTPPDKIRLNPAHFLGNYRWPVHFISSSLYQKQKLPEGSYHLLLWRHPHSLKIEFMEVSPLVKALIGLLSNPQRPEVLLETLAKDLKLSKKDKEPFLEQGKALIETWKQKALLV